MSKQIRVSDTAHEWIVAEAQYNHRNIIGQVDAMVAHKPVKERMAEMKPEDVPESWRPMTTEEQIASVRAERRATFTDKPKPHPKGKSK